MSKASTSQAADSEPGSGLTPEVSPRSPPADQEVRERLLDAALKVFATLGYDAASLRTIAEAAGVAYQLIGYYFGAKEDLWQAAVDVAYRRETELGRSLGFDLSGDLREQFRHHLRILVVGSSQNPEWRNIVTHEFLSQSTRYHEVIKPRLHEIVRVLSRPYVGQLVRLGIVTRFSAQEIHLLIDALFRYIFTNRDEYAAITGESAETLRSLNALADLVFSVCIRGKGSLRTEQPVALESVPVEPSPKESSGSDHLWGEQYNALSPSELTRLRQLEAENEHLKQLVGELSLDKRLLQQALGKRTS